MTQITPNITEPQILFESRLLADKDPNKVASYRIPSLLKTKKGTLIAGVDQRHDHHWDWGNIDMVVRRSEDNGQTWGPIIPIVDLPTNPQAKHPEYNSAMNIDMTLLQDPTTERIFSIFGMFPEIQGSYGILEDNKQRHENNQPLQKEAQHLAVGSDIYLAVYKGSEVYTVREEGYIYTPDHQKTAYRVITESARAPYHDLGDLYENDTKIGNVYFMDAPFRIAKAMFLWLSYSDDEGQSWSSPRDITPQVKEPWMAFFGIGPGVSLTLDNGRLVAPTYSTNHPYELNGSQSSRVIYSDDHGETWQAGAAVNDDRTLADGTRIHSATMDAVAEQNTEASAVQLNSGTVLLFMRNLSGYVQSAKSIDGGQTWEDGITTHTGVTDVYCQLAAIQTVQEGQEYVLLVNADGPQRTNGVVRVAKVNPDDSLTWLAKKPIQAGKYAYNAIQQIDADLFGVLYEHTTEDRTEYSILFKTFDWAYLTEE
ncbi:sialidase family protein [Fundicoccus culcitae]|uniref:exo-alpha-sialidase n=1 Tax=Fundicoccus culcitae TaxID=2969821 RepID=A0ABY5PA17_9LACT|nr:sialidase family protein [Fundicoccus culcitae]UUX35283.1 glycoside hydrolase [Fundicoccus culcitae]